MEKYLKASEFIDWDNPLVLAQAKELAGNMVDHEKIAKVCFEFVRDKIRHSWDYELNPVTCKASSVLEHKTGYCYAKSHLLAALFRVSLE
jgi:transglutaminase-like putative cysteine protease